MPTVICSLGSGAIVSLDKEHSKFLRWKVTLKMCASSLSLLLLLVESILCFIRNDKALERREREDLLKTTVYYTCTLKMIR